jgi:hypothetical protein
MRQKTKKSDLYDPSRKVVFHLLPALREALDARDARANHSLVAQRDLARYYVLLAREMAHLKIEKEDLQTIAKAVRGRTLDANDADLLWGAVADHDPNLARRLRELTPGQAMSLVDAAERFQLGRASGLGPAKSAEAALEQAPES